MTFHADCVIGDNLALECQILFSGEEKRKKVKLSSAENVSSNLHLFSLRDPSTHLQLHAFLLATINF